MTQEERFQVIEQSTTGHCCFSATVVDMFVSTMHGRPDPICECFDEKNAVKIKDLLNLKEKNQ